MSDGEEEKGKWTHIIEATWKELQDTSPRYTPYVTYGLLTANILMFLATFGAMSNDPWSVGLTASEFIENPLAPKVLLSMFAHAGIIHLLGNMAYLYKHGDNVEAAMGRLRYLVFYLICGYAAVASQVLYSSAVGTPRVMLAPMVGASGAISGVLGAYLYLWPGASTYRCFCFRFSCYCMRLTARRDIAIWLGFQFVLPVLEPSVAVFAHLGGLVAGIALAPIIAKRENVARLRQMVKQGEYRGPPPDEYEVLVTGWDGVVKVVVALAVIAVVAVAALGVKGHMWHVYTVKYRLDGGVEELVETGLPQPLKVERVITGCLPVGVSCFPVDGYLLVSHGPASNIGILLSVGLIGALLLLLYDAVKSQREWEVL
ncbi:MULTISPECIES: rhomboid family intramembrane serine protease [Pyrobaculum]|uniref:Rhomboid family intramembrane serine protease n=1 Tax=Pyrobaculum arsenaticum TaxID=121277 RepID=A0A7L4PAE7_9CREN|nr:rhomboid family intramembrane serine protease [Pyrobaculum arsenaticum]NYR15841.1 rhomboid family intramembrane serine protease [Pyrobaculum arsenaticum]